MKTIAILISLLLSSVTFSANVESSPENIILITIDGLRWQEVFRGISISLANNEEYSARSEDVLTRFQGGSPAESARKLMPFLHNTVLKEGSVIGNRDQNSCAQVSNPWYFSYPGYSEILTGYADPGIDSNDRVNNPNKTFMEWVSNTIPDYTVAAFASWDVFPYIFNVERSGIEVNVGAKENPETTFEATLNRLYNDIPSPWATVRLDAFTHHYAMSHLKNHHPRVTYISYGETDDFAHDGHYDQYIFSANRSDRFINEIWSFVQSDPFYKDNTVLFITVDHGRGEVPEETWQHHASKKSLSGYMTALAQYEDGIVGSEAVWMAAIGPGISSRGLIETGSNCVESNQVAATLLHVIGLDYLDFNSKAGAPIMEMLGSQ